MNIPGYSGTIETNKRLAPLTTWNIGGPADCLVAPRTLHELRSILAFARTQRVPIAIIGRGSNVLIEDAGVRGMVICLRRTLQDVSYDAATSTIRAAAGCPLPTLATCARRACVTGFEFMIGIPGTVGAGIAINAGTGGIQGPSLSDLVIEVELLDLRDGRLFSVAAGELDMGYRHTRIPDMRSWVTSATFRASDHASPEDIDERQRAVLAKRSREQPLSKWTSGSVFAAVDNGKAAGWYIDQCGLKGFRIGGASVSSKHANWIENDGTATSDNVRTLIAEIQARVTAAFGVQLRREVVFLEGVVPG